MLHAPRRTLAPVLLVFPRKDFVRARSVLPCDLPARPKARRAPSPARPPRTAGSLVRCWRLVLGPAAAAHRALRCRALPCHVVLVPPIVLNAALTPNACVAEASACR